MSLRPSERLTGLVLLALLAAALLLRPPGWSGRALGFAVLLAGQLAVARAPEGRAGGALRDLFPVAAILGTFLLLQPLVAANPRRWDAALAAADARWLGRLVARWRGAFGRPPAFTDLVYLAYASFYFLPLTAALLARRRGPARFERTAFTILLGFYLSFLGYALWPAEGPRVPAALEAGRLGGGAIAEAIRTFLRQAEVTTLDAFPSGHTALSLLPAWLATGTHPRLAPLLWAWAAAVVFATVYISVHYAVDVLGGALLAALALVLAGPLERALGGQ